MILFELKRAILESGFKQTFIARKAGLDPTILSKKLHGHCPITTEEKLRLAGILRKTTQELFPPREV